MYPQTYRMLAARQETYWWHRARRALAFALFRRYGPKDVTHALDLGCGPGGNLELFAPLSPELVCGIDLSRLALSLAAEAVPRANLVRADISKPLPFADASFDVVTVFNVLYHDWVVHEVDTLVEIVRVLKPGGLVLMTEPAFKMLAREMDEVAMARRRYRCDEFATMCRAAGLRTYFTSYFTSFGFPLLLLMKLLRRSAANVETHAIAAHDMKPLPGFIDAAFYAIAMIETRLLTFGLRMPCGTTLVCVASRPTQSG
jgi:SAM-dependent methyltransferase